MCCHDLVDTHAEGVSNRSSNMVEPAGVHAPLDSRHRRQAHPGPDRDVELRQPEGDAPSADGLGVEYDGHGVIDSSPEVACQVRGFLMDACGRPATRAIDETAARKEDVGMTTTQMRIRAMKRPGWTDDDFHYELRKVADRLGIDPPGPRALTRWFAGDIPEGKNLFLLCELAQVSADYILGFSDDSSPPDPKARLARKRAAAYFASEEYRSKPRRGHPGQRREGSGR